MIRTTQAVFGRLNSYICVSSNYLPIQLLGTSLNCRRSASKNASEGKSSSKANNSKKETNSLSEVQNKKNHHQKLTKKMIDHLPSAPAEFPADSGIETLLKKDTKPYFPKMEYKRESYEYPGLPNEDEFAKYSDKIEKRKQVTRWTRHIPKIISGLVVIWGMYVVKVWYLEADEDSDQNELLSVLEFHTFIITHKQQIDKDHYIVEVKPKNNHWKYSTYAHYDRKSIWDGDKIWSVEVKHPQIMVVRSYTPLPLYFLKSARTRSGEEEPLLKVIDNGEDTHDQGGVMLFYIKRYNDGEVSRYILNKDIGDEIELRGPQVDYTFPYHPLKPLHTRPTFRDLPSKVEAETSLDSLKIENNLPEYDTLDFYAAGTGIAPILQVLFSRNPYRGFVNVHYSAKNEKELGPLDRFTYFLEKLDRIKVIKHLDTDPKSRLSSFDILKPVPVHFKSQHRKEKMKQTQGDVDLSEVRSEKSLELLKKRLAVLEGERKEVLKKPVDGLFKRKVYYPNALAQAQVTSAQKKSDASLSLVCGPDGYMKFVAGEKALATGEQGSVTGLLGKKGWDNHNVFKL